MQEQKGLIDVSSDRIHTYIQELHTNSSIHQISNSTPASSNLSTLQPHTKLLKPHEPESTLVQDVRQEPARKDGRYSKERHVNSSLHFHHDQLANTAQSSTHPSTSTPPKRKPPRTSPPPSTPECAQAATPSPPSSPTAS